MSPDARLRSLERSAASGDLDSQARSLLERVRAGTLTRERIVVAAFAADRAAQLALGCGRCLGCGTSWFPRPPEPPQVCPCCSFDGWARELRRFDRVAQIVAAHAVCEAAAKEVAGPRPEFDAVTILGISRVGDWIKDSTINIDGAQLLHYLLRGLSCVYWLACAASEVVWNAPRSISFDDHMRQCLADALTVLRGWEAERAAKRALIAWALCPSPSPPAPHVDPDPETTGA